MVVRGFVEPDRQGSASMEYALELNRLIELQMRRARSDDGLDHSSRRKHAHNGARAFSDVDAFERSARPRRSGGSPVAAAIRTMAPYVPGVSMIAGQRASAAPRPCAARSTTGRGRRTHRPRCRPLLSPFNSATWSPS